MFNLKGHSSISDFFASSIASMVDMYDNKRYAADNDNNVIHIKHKDKVLHRVASINNNDIYIDDYDDIYVCEKARFLYIIPINKLTYIGYFDFMLDIRNQYPTKYNSVYDCLMSKRRKYLREKALEDIFKG